MTLLEKLNKYITHEVIITTDRPLDLILLIDEHITTLPDKCCVYVTWGSKQLLIALSDDNRKGQLLKYDVYHFYKGGVSYAIDYASLIRILSDTYDDDITTYKLSFILYDD